MHLVNASSLDHDDPVLNGYLAFVGRDIAKHPGRLTVFPAALVERARALVSGVPIDRNAAIDGAIAP